MRRVGSVLAVLLLLVGMTALPAQAETRNPRNAEPLYLVMDVSGSMGGARLKEAQRAAHKVLKGLEQDQVFALYTFPGGHKVVDNCLAGRFIMRPQRINQGNAGVAVDLLSATGNTPTVPALKEIMRNVKNNGYERARVVLVTDGEANCGESSDVCTIVPLLDQQGIKLEINTVSLDNTPSGDASLACLAQGTGGTATTVDNVDQLVDAVRRNSSYAATLDVDVPDAMPRVTGRARELAPDMSVTVTSVGSAMIQDASLIVTFTSGDAARRVELEPNGILPLGNLERGRSTFRSLTLYPMATADGPVTWKVTLIAGGIPVESKTGTVRLTSGTTVDTAGSILRDAQHVVIMGDSYSSGEGGGSYDEDYSSRVGLCHRSAKAYGRILFKDATMIACSGGLTTDLTHFNALHGFTGWVEPQLFELLKVTASEATPDLVLMTLGGNDSGFADVVTGFVVSSTAEDAPPVRPPLEWATLTSRLVRSYGQVNAIVNAPAAIAKRQGKVAQIIILPYVRPLPRAGGDGCFALISRHELDLANDFATSVNETVRRAVGQASDAGVPIHYASPVEHAFLPDHTICDGKDSYAQTISMDNTESTAASIWRGLSPARRQELMHPTAEGYRAEAASLVEWSRTVSPKPLGSTTSDYGAISVQSFSLPGFVIEPGHGVDVSLCIEACEFGSIMVTVTSWSMPVPLGTLSVSPGTQRPQGSIVLPDEVPPGKHTIVLRGYDNDGHPHQATFDIVVWRTGSNRGIYLAGLGSVILLLATALAVAQRLRRPEHA